MRRRDGAFTVDFCSRKRTQRSCGFENSPPQCTLHGLSMQTRTEQLFLHGRIRLRRDTQTRWTLFLHTSCFSYSTILACLAYARKKHRVHVPEAPSRPRCLRTSTRTILFSLNARRPQSVKVTQQHVSTAPRPLVVQEKCKKYGIRFCSHFAGANDVISIPK